MLKKGIRRILATALLAVSGAVLAQPNICVITIAAEKGETLESLARNFNLPTSALISCNPYHPMGSAPLRAETIVRIPAVFNDDASPGTLTEERSLVDQEKRGNRLRAAFGDKVAKMLDRFGDMIAEASSRYGLPASLGLGLVWTESTGNPKARSHKGAVGLTQITPITMVELGMRPADALKPSVSVDKGFSYLASLIREFGSVEKGLLAYNLGPNGARLYLRAKGKAERHRYVRKVLKAAAKFK